MPLQRAKERALVAQVIVDLVRTVHLGRMSARGSLAGEVETLLISAVVISAHVAGHPKTAAEVGRALGIPRITVRRKLESLVHRGLLRKDRTRYLGVDGGDHKYVDKALAIIKRAAASGGGS